MPPILKPTPSPAVEKAKQWLDLAKSTLPDSMIKTLGELMLSGIMPDPNDPQMADLTVPLMPPAIGMAARGAVRAAKKAGTLGQAAAKPVAEGTLGAALHRIPNPLKAYHGSPHDFDQFSLSKIGTGEGAQAYGHGLYFAENQGVAESYKTGGTVTNKYKAGSDLELSLVQQYMNREGSKAGAIKSMRETMKANPPKTPAEQKYWDALKDGADRLEAEKVIPPRLYEVNLHATPDELLDWDKPLSEQPQKVREALKQAKVLPDWHQEWNDIVRRQDEIAELPSARHADPSVIAESEALDTRLQALRRKIGVQDQHWSMGRYNQGPKGEDLYRKAADARADRGLAPILSDKSVGEDATETLRQAGIKGIQYLDQGSRAAGTGTRNFVIFDDQLIEIKRKFGFATTAAAAEWVRQNGGVVQSRDE